MKIFPPCGALKTGAFLFRNVPLVIIGVTIMSFGISLMRYAALGIDPYSCMNIGVSQRLGMSFGTWQLICNALLLAGVIISDRKRIGFGTVYNMIATGYTSDFFLGLLTIAGFPDESVLAVRIASLIVGVAILSFGAALYIEANRGVSPYDALAIILADKTRRSAWFRWYRIGTDVLCVIGGLLTQSDVGIGTLITACFTGPLIAFFRQAAASLQKPPLAAGNKQDAMKPPLAAETENNAIKLPLAARNRQDAMKPPIAAEAKNRQDAMKPPLAAEEEDGN